MATSKERKRKRLRYRSRTEVNRTLWVLGVPTSESLARGLQAEEKVLAALRYHQKKKTKFPGNRVIIEVSPTLHFSLDDKRGIDINVSFRLEDGSCEPLPIQVQSWWRREAENRFRGRGICLIVVWRKEDKEVAKRKAHDALFKWLSTREQRSEVASIL